MRTSASLCQRFSGLLTTGLWFLLLEKLFTLLNSQISSLLLRTSSSNFLICFSQTILMLLTILSLSQSVEIFDELIALVVFIPENFVASSFLSNSSIFFLKHSFSTLRISKLLWRLFESDPLVSLWKNVSLLISSFSDELQVLSSLISSLWFKRLSSSNESFYSKLLSPCFITSYDPCSIFFNFMHSIRRALLSLKSFSFISLSYFTTQFSLRDDHLLSVSFRQKWPRALSSFLGDFSPYIFFFTLSKVSSWVWSMESVQMLGHCSSLDWSFCSSSVAIS